jgi:hypothetical protein
MIYVSAAHGNDANSGTLAAPFRQIAKALEQSPAGQTVGVIDSGDYEKFSVNKSQVPAAAAGFGNTAVTEYSVSKALQQPYP